MVFGENWSHASSCNDCKLKNQNLPELQKLSQNLAKANKQGHSFRDWKQFKPAFI